jgi:hypothetical protein
MANGSAEVAHTQNTHGTAEGIRTVNAVIAQGDSLARPDVVPTSKFLGKFSSLPTLNVGAESLRALIQSQNLRDFEDVNAKAVRMTQTAGLFSSGKSANNAFGYTHTGLSQLVSFLGAPRNATGVLEYLDPDARAFAFQSIAQKAMRDESIVLRTMRNGGRQIVRAVTSERHSLADGDDLATLEAIEASIPSNALVRFTRQWERSDFEIILPTQAFEVKKGDPVFARIHVTNSETKGASLNVFGGLFRAWCLNGMARPADESESTFGIRHLGNPRQRIKNAIRVAILGINEFAEQFGEAHQIALPLPQAETLERVGKAFPELSTAFLKSAGTVWGADGSEKSAGHTVAGLANALTRAAQELPMAEATEVQAVAGKIVARGLSALS